MKHFVIGKAEHVDHGKTALIKELTGVDTDCLKKEKETLPLNWDSSHLLFLPVKLWVLSMSSVMKNSSKIW